MLPLPLQALWSYRRAIGIGVGALALVVGVWAYGHSRYAAGRDAGRDKVMALWAEDALKRDQATAAAIAAARQAEADARKANEVIEREYLEKVAAANATRDQYVGLFEQARNQVRFERSAAHTGALIAAQSREAYGAERIERSLKRVERAAERVGPESTATADQLDALIAVIKPQM